MYPQRLASLGAKRDEERGRRQERPRRRLDGNGRDVIEHADRGGGRDRAQRREEHQVDGGAERGEHYDAAHRLRREADAAVHAVSDGAAAECAKADGIAQGVAAERCDRQDRQGYASADVAQATEFSRDQRHKARDGRADGKSNRRGGQLPQSADQRAIVEVMGQAVDQRDDQDREHEGDDRDSELANRFHPFRSLGTERGCSRARHRDDPGSISDLPQRHSSKMAITMNLDSRDRSCGLSSANH